VKVNGISIDIYGNVYAVRVFGGKEMRETRRNLMRWSEESREKPQKSDGLEFRGYPLVI